MRPIGVTKENKKGQKLSRVKLAISPDHLRRGRPLKFFIRRRTGLGATELCVVENRSLPLTRPMAYRTACTAVQAVIYTLMNVKKLTV